MMIQVNNSTWVRTKEVVKISIDRGQMYSTGLYKFRVTIETVEEHFYELFDTIEQAQNAAQRIANQINNAEEAHHVED